MPGFGSHQGAETGFFIVNHVIKPFKTSINIQICDMDHRLTPVSPFKMLVNRRVTPLRGCKMCQNLAGLGLKLDEISGQRAIESLDQELILADLRDAGVPARQRAWLALQRLSDFDRILLAQDNHTGHCQGLVLIKHGATTHEQFLTIETLVGTPRARGEALLQRMVAFLLLRLGTMEEHPTALLARARHPSLCQVLHAIGMRIPSVAFYPEPDDTVISLNTASLAHRMARSTDIGRRFYATRAVLQGGTGGVPVDGPMLAVLDLRKCDDAQLIEGARQLFRARLPRSLSRQAVSAPAPVQIAAR